APVEHLPTETIGAIVVGVDGSPSSITALRTAGNLSTALNTKLKIITVWQVPSSAGDVYGTELVGDETDKARRIQYDALREAFGDLQPDGHESIVIEGDSAAVLIDEGSSASMIVVGSRGYGTVVGLLMG